MRRQVKELLDAPEDDTIYPEENDSWNPWDGAKDGKQWIPKHRLKPEYLRK